MEAMFHSDPVQANVQTTPMVTDVMTRVVDELEKLNRAAKFERKHKNIDWRNDRTTWRADPDPQESMVLPSLPGNRVKSIKSRRMKKN